MSHKSRAPCNRFHPHRQRFPSTMHGPVVCLAKNNLSTECQPISPQLHAKAINTGQANLLSISRCPQLYQSNSTGRCLLTRYGSTLTTQQSINASHMHPLLNCKSHFRTGMSLKLVRHRQPRKPNSKAQKYGSLGTIWRSIQLNCIIGEAKWFIHYTPYAKEWPHSFSENQRRAEQDRGDGDNIYQNAARLDPNFYCTVWLWSTRCATFL